MYDVTKYTVVYNNALGLHIHSTCSLAQPEQLLVVCHFCLLYHVFTVSFLCIVTRVLNIVFTVAYSNILYRFM